MGRMWDALRGASNVQSGHESLHATPIEDAEPMLVESEEVPFIEVGPRKSMEASPSVLASEKKVEKCGRIAQGIHLSPSEKPASRRVPFRAVFLVAPDAEADTPQTDT